MLHPFFFGYGSLVNRDSHNFPHGALAKISGWRRFWGHRIHAGEDHGVTSLSVHPVASAEILGLIAAVPDDDWAALDLREAGYDRTIVPADTIAHDAHVREISIYVARQPAPTPNEHFPILQSYLDCVGQGFLREYGPEGLAHFFETTDNWGVIENDRLDPRYPRAVTLTEDERAQIDAHVAALDLPK
ncbi:gamma-glutamylcyclotransferase family protein [Paracoccaceae bacterium GXU_MW_L88]